MNDNDIFEMKFLVTKDNELNLDINWTDDFDLYPALPHSIALLLFSVSNGKFAEAIKQQFLNKAQNDEHLSFIKQIFIELEIVAEEKLKQIKNSPVITSTEVLKGLPPI